NIVKCRVKSRYFERSPGARLDASSAAEPDRDLIVLDDHRNGAAPLAVPEHALELSEVLLDVDVVERNVPPLIVFTGGLRVRSGVLAVDRDHVHSLQQCNAAASNRGRRASAARSRRSAEASPSAETR